MEAAEGKWAVAVTDEVVKSALRASGPDSTSEI
jgi:hypothetical protein